MITLYDINNPLRYDFIMYKECDNINCDNPACYFIKKKRGICQKCYEKLVKRYNKKPKNKILNKIDTSNMIRLL